MNSEVFKIAATILKAKAEADFCKNSLTFYFSNEKQAMISGVLSESEIPFTIIGDDAISVTGDNNIQTALWALVDADLLEHGWLSQIITRFPAPDKGYHRLMGQSFFKSKSERENELKQKNIETKLETLLNTQCSFIMKTCFNAAAINLPKDTTSEKLQEHVDTLKKANINVKISLDNKHPDLLIDKKESNESITVKLDDSINSNRSYFQNH